MSVAGALLWITWAKNCACACNYVIYGWNNEIALDAINARNNEKYINQLAKQTISN